MKINIRAFSIFFLAAALALSAITVAPVTPAYASAFVVNSLNDVDDGTCNGTHCSLREAINAATFVGSNDIITFSVSGTIYLSSILPTIYSDGTLTIDGGNTITISGDTNMTGAGDVQIFSVFNGGNLTLQNITLTKGMNSVSSGGAVTNQGILTINNSIISDSATTAVSSGGGAVSSETGSAVLTITNSTFSDNTTAYLGAPFLTLAAAQPPYQTPHLLEIWPSAVTAAQSIIAVQPLLFPDSVFSGNIAFDNAGAIINQVGSGTFTISGSTFIDNQANFAGAIMASNGNAEISNSTFSNNSAVNDAGAIYFTGSGSLNISNSTFSENSTISSRGGAIFSFGSVSLTNVTLSRIQPPTAMAAAFKSITIR
ncbi:MAG: CSLREA domain-containing protein [Anaerolineales bacterium]|uniref:CSLREA domain-containing protein n=1 Tax=Candidatus Villigracilis proximus TaxID=3140683 RepID=UPI00313701E1|nr:CSLREA domain-containing protein [Anaerolineales bacterium]